MVPKDLNIEIHKGGVEKLEIKCCCRPTGDQKDMEYISQFINLEIPITPSKKDQGAKKGSPKT